MITKEIARYIKNILRSAGPMTRVSGRLIMERIDCTAEQYSEALDLIQAEGKFRVIRMQGQGAAVAMA